MLATLLEAAAPRGAALGSAAATVMPLPLPPSLPRALAWGDEVSVSHVRAVQKIELIQDEVCHICVRGLLKVAVPAGRGWVGGQAGGWASEKQGAWC